MTALTAAMLVLRPGAADAAESLAAALADSRWGLDFRFRIEWVDEDGFDEDAEASTLRSRLHLKTGAYRGFQGFIEFSDVREIGLDNFNAGAGSTPDRVRFPLVADPEDTRLNQAWIGYQPHEGVTIRAGRQRIQLDNDRFVGNVGWRQNEQTFDAGRLDWEHGRWKLFYSYIAQANRIFDSSVPAGKHDHDTHLLNAAFSLAEGHRLTGYYYHIEDEEQQSFSNRTFGVRYTGTRTLAGARSLSWLAEFARQAEAGDNPVDYNANYFHIRADVAFDPHFKPLVGFERLAGSRRPGAAFRTPLATLHAFNGWADRFLSTPDSGLDDFYAGFTGARGRLGWQLIWHHFSTETGSTKLGDELDASFSIALHRTSSLLLKLAHFSDDDAVPGATKAWLMWAVALP